MRALKVDLAAMALLIGASLAGTVGCSPGDNGTSVGGGAGGNNPSQGGSAGQGQGGSSGVGGMIITLPDAAPMGGAGGSTVAEWPPAGYVNRKSGSYGEYALGPKPSEQTAMPKPGQCAGLFGVIRDFKMNNAAGEGHPDFQTVTSASDVGIVTDTLGDDGKPVYAKADGKTTTTTGKESFDQWYRDVEGVNQTFLLGLKFVANGNVVTFAASLGNTDSDVPNTYFFPLDGQGWDDQGKGADGEMHNFAFTTEIHTTFTYNGGETFKFQGDDDVFVYINKRLAIDLGGIHKQKTQTVDLDAQAEKLGIEKGKVYELAVFNAERHTSESNFRIDTTMVFEDCGTIIL